MMKKLVLAMSLALPMIGGNALADNSAFVALENTSSVVQMSDQELLSVQGGAYDFCFACILGNTAVVTQVNLSIASLGALQSNKSYIDQSNN